jgi:hypothetical protein
LDHVIIGRERPGALVGELLAEGRLVNLALAEGHPPSVMDMSFANQALSAIYMRQHAHELANQVYSVPEHLDQEIARMKLTAMGVAIDVLTMNNAAAKLDIRNDGSLNVVADYNQMMGWTNVDGVLKAREVLALTGFPGIASTRIAMVGNATGHKEIYICDADGENLRQVTRDGSISLGASYARSSEIGQGDNHIRNNDLRDIDL